MKNVPTGMLQEAVKAIRNALSSPYIRAVAVTVAEHEILLTEREALANDDSALLDLLRTRLERRRDISKFHDEPTGETS